jgi:hypothetical protein
MTDHIGVITLRDAAVNSVFLVVADLTGRTRARGHAAAIGRVRDLVRRPVAGSTRLRHLAPTEGEGFMSEKFTREQIEGPWCLLRPQRTPRRRFSRRHRRQGVPAPRTGSGGKRKKARWIPEGERPT